MKEKVLVLLSGGLDSTTLLYKLKEKMDTVAISFHYNQRHRKEIICARDICKEINVIWRPINVASISSIFGDSALINVDKALPKKMYDNDTLKVTVVPNRNMILISLAAAFAISNGITNIAYAAHAGDHEVYPDCRPEFVERIRTLLQVVSWTPIHLHTPFVYMQKSEIVYIGSQIGVPFEKTWSCYEGRELHCGECSTCIERKKAFKDAGITDLTTYLGGKKDV